ncbi:acyl-CoA dehydrogenase family protein [Frankia sp. AgB1.9]|uniref:acyl-CoA dehydrogenase family protein n=1 Tax=unclassified Frankia TaxID=2632575 RepID=UPI00193159B4|nr:MULTISPECIES: acyl-CoA dehydrogenase family protein [unclassified Frankia]MBL7488162.1 acyl-CoA dehydrogenase family protein [Frankia sp. AgW1.1]MBL7553316.1 acyl-CoA dehydrogenase family protein [Frankia sp. AgB1.9]MBL7620165.1 acyl-CoA dehydrogenase family protein [Frankia sp. AgB1.8]
MIPSLTADQELFVDTTRKFLRDSLPGEVRRALHKQPRGYEPAYWKTGAELGWTSLLVSEDHGGGSVSGDGLRDLALVAHEFGRHAAPGPLLAANIAALALSRAGGEAALEALDRAGAGEALVAWCPSEPAPGDGLGQVAARAVASGTGWVLSGAKGPVEHGAQADQFVVPARTDEGLIQLLVPADSAGVTVRPLRTVDVSRRFARVGFDGVRVPASHVLAGPASGAAEVERLLHTALAIQTAETVGAMDRAFEMTVAWAADRYSFGRPLASYQALKHRFADLKMWLEASHAVADAAVEAVGGGDPRAGELVSVAKSYIGHFGPELCQDCVQLHGGIGLTFEHDLHLYLRRVTVNSMLLGTVREHRLRLASLLGGVGEVTA